MVVKHTITTLYVVNSSKLYKFLKRWKIPTIVNGKIKYSHNKGSAKSINIQPSSQKPRITKHKHKVKIIGDSHLRDSATRVNQYLSSNFEVCSLIKLGANANQIVISQEKELNCLGEKDIIVINGGANDLDKTRGNLNGILAFMINFIQKYNMNIIIIGIPHQHDLHKADRVNLQILAFNVKLKNILKKFKHVSMVEMRTNRRHFTKYGFHQNSLGKERLAKQIAFQIDGIVKSRSIARTAVSLKWKEITPNLNFGNNWTSTEIVIVNSQNPTFQAADNQSLKINNESMRRTFTRIKKAPTTMTKDFLW